MYLRFIVAALLLGSTLKPAVAAGQPRLYDCAHFAENGNDVVVDKACILRALRNGANPNAINRESKRAETTLSHLVMFASIARQPDVISAGIEAVRMLIHAGAKLQPLDAGILFWPIAQGKEALVRMLLDLGASPTEWPNAEIGTALSPVEYAAAQGRKSIVALLVARGAHKPSSRTAIQEQFVRVASLGTAARMAALLSQGANVNARDADKETALINAISWGGADECDALNKVQLLLAKGADPNLSGRSPALGVVEPLHAAVWMNSILRKGKRSTLCSDQIIRQLLKDGAYVSGVDEDGRTPLHIAAKDNNVAAAKLLIDLGAKIMPRDHEGRTPLDLAQSGNMIRLLKKHGATER